MWQREIEKQQIEVEGRLWCAADRPALETLSRTEADNALRDVYAFLSDWFESGPCMQVQTSGSTGQPKQMAVEKQRMVNSACLTCAALGLKAGDTALLCMDMKYIGAKMMVVRALVAGMKLLIRPATGHPMTLIDRPVDFTAIIPLQLYNSLQTDSEKTRLSECRNILVGGGAVDDNLCRLLQPLPCKVYSTYGMTETLSHIALRRLNGQQADGRYRPMEGVSLSLSQEQTLVIHAPAVCGQTLVTNDVAQLFPDGSFVILGRKDNTVNSGGIKIQIEADEAILRRYIKVPFALTSAPDERLGEALVLLVQDDSCDLEHLKRLMSRELSVYHRPRHIFAVGQVPLTGNGKIDRRACKDMAGVLVGQAARM